MPASPSRVPGLAAASLPGLAGQGRGQGAGGCPTTVAQGWDPSQAAAAPSQGSVRLFQELLLAQYGR